MWKHLADRASARCAPVSPADGCLAMHITSRKVFGQASAKVGFYVRVCFTSGTWPGSDAWFASFKGRGEVEVYTTTCQRCGSPSRAM